MEVERAFPDPEQGRRDDLAVVGEDDEVRLERQDLVDRRRITQLGGRQDRSGSELRRRLRQRRGDGCQLPTRRPGRAP